MERHNVDYSLYYVTGRLLTPPNLDFYESLESACKGGVTIVQLREKNITTREFLEIGTKVKSITDRYSIPLLINDRLDIALALGVGLHVGQSDMEISLVRKLLGDKVILGVSINTTEELDTVIKGGWSDYVGCGPVHFTRSKDVLSPILGGRGISKILKHLALNPLKIVAIGGISEFTIDNLMRQSPAYLSPGSYRHLDGVAIISAIAGSQTPQEASVHLLSRYKAGLQNYSTATASSTHSSLLDSAISLLAGLRTNKDVRPLVHSITNTVVQNDCANLTLALGGSPIMSASPQEATELGSIISSLLINFGTLNTSQREAFEVAGKEANRTGKPIIFDPVGVGATSFRREGAFDLMGEVHMSVIKGNAGEIGTLFGSDEVKSLGVDSIGSGFKDPAKVVRELAQREKCIIAMSGEVDYISDGITVIKIENGHRLQGLITGSGCMTTTSIAVFASRSKNILHATVAGFLAINVAAEIAGERSDVKGNATFRNALIDECSNVGVEELKARARFEVL